jgi:hypothetical protein
MDITWQKQIDTTTETTWLGWIAGRCEFRVGYCRHGSSASRPIGLERFDDRGFPTFVGSYATIAGAKAAAKRAAA